MKKVLLIIFFTFFISTLVWLVFKPVDSSLDTNSSQTMSSNTIVTATSSDFEIVNRTEVVEAMYPGGMETLEYEVPYIVFDSGEEIRVFDEPQARVDYVLISDSKKFIYFSQGVGVSDAGVIPYVYDIENRNLRKVCFGEICTPASGFFGQHLLEVTWLSNDRLEIIYQNPNLPPGADDGDLPIGEQVFRSVEGKPWILIQEYEY